MIEIFYYFVYLASEIGCAPAIQPMGAQTICYPANVDGVTGLMMAILLPSTTKPAAR
jgi:hypothetical protein